MPRIFINEIVDIFKCPKVDTTYPAVDGIQIIIGDLHGNTIKLLFILIKHGIASNISYEDYASLVTIYTRMYDFEKEAEKNLVKFKQTAAEDLEKFTTILNQMTFCSKSSLILLGDELSDRGNNDYLTLLLLAFLVKTVKLDILFSNHTAEFLHHYEKKGNFKDWRYIDTIRYAISMRNMHILLNHGIIKYDDVLKLVSTIYIPSLKVLSYTLDTAQNKIYIYSHAPIDINSIEKIAMKIECSYAGDSTLELAKTIDSINEAFKKHIQNKTVNKLYDFKTIETAPDPLTFVIQNRNTLALNLNKAKFASFIHGHCGAFDPHFKINEESPTRISLNNQLGMYLNGEPNNQGCYEAMYYQNPMQVVEEEESYSLDLLSNFIPVQKKTISISDESIIQKYSFFNSPTFVDNPPKVFNFKPAAN